MSSPHILILIGIYHRLISIYPTQENKQTCSLIGEVSNKNIKLDGSPPSNHCQKW